MIAGLFRGSLTENPRNDIRYNLATILHSGVARQHFEMIIVDAPPRLTTGCIQAMCAGTHILIPTVLDNLSGEAVGTFVTQLQILRPVCPFLKLIGVVGNMTGANVQQLQEPRAIADINLALDKLGKPTDLLPTQLFIPDRAALGRIAGKGIAYVQDGDSYDEVRTLFAALGAEVDRRMRE